MSTVHLLNEAASEIKALRRRNEILEAKVSVVDAFTRALHGRRDHGPMAMEEDIVGRIDRKIDEMFRELIPPPVKTADQAEGMSKPDRSPAGDEEPKIPATPPLVRRKTKRVKRQTARGDARPTGKKLAGEDAGAPREKRKYRRRGTASIVPEAPAAEPVPAKRGRRPAAIVRSTEAIMGDKPDTLGGAMKLLARQFKKPFTAAELIEALKADADYEQILENSSESSVYSNLMYWAKTNKLKKTGEGSDATYDVLNLEF